MIKAFSLFFLMAFGLVQAKPLNEFTVLSIDPQQGLEPSGLTIFKGQLLTVSDKHSWVYRLEIKDDSAAMVPYLFIDKNALGFEKLDMEGITHDGEDLYLISESAHKLIHFKPDQTVSWAPQQTSFYAKGHADGLFQVNNAGLEAGVYLGDDIFLLAAERQPRGLIKVKFDTKKRNIVEQKNTLMDNTGFKLIKNRSPDFTGLYQYAGQIYALHRNAYVISELNEEEGVYVEGKSWSYQHIIEHPDQRYHDMKYGHAEGLAVDEDNFYLVLDNNKDYKLKDPQDNRPLLIIAKRN